MDNGMMPNAKRYTNRRRQWKRWQKLVSVLGCIVVFCTTYALIIPAITQERETFCGMEEHIHGKDCKAATVVTELVCTVAEGDGHIHDESCYTDTEGHVHTDGCYEVTAGHSHNENCYILTGGHTHSDGCYTQVGGHTHGDGCYEWSVICNAAEEEGHEHTEECQQQVRTLVCTQPESAPQTVLTCGLDETPAQQVLVCELEETAETRVLVCTLEEAESRRILTCTLEEAQPHTHGEECYTVTEQEGEDTCSKEEHEHTTICYSDPSADVETAAAWERSFAGLKLTGLWAKDVLELAETQLGYQESIRNYVMSGDETKGYTRYGAWYGDPYGDWCAMFVSFCLNYAEVEGIPLNSNCQNWIETLSGETLDLYRAKDNYEPRPGDLIFFDWTGDGCANHVGLVKSLEEEEGGLVLTTLEGNASNRVRTNTYDIADESILGYGALPAYALEETTRDVEIYTDGSYTTAAEDGTSITVSGTIPKAASIRAYAVAPETELKVLCAYEISIILPDGTVFEPTDGDSLNVNIQCGAIEEDGTTLEVYYIPEEGAPEPIDTVVTDEGVAFDADHFSTYALTVSGNMSSVYLNGASGKDTNTGGQNAPVKTLERACELVSSGGTIYITGTVTISDDAEWTEGGVTIRRGSSFTGPLVQVNGTLTLSDITIHGGSSNPSSSNIATNSTYAGSSKAPLIVVGDNGKLVINSGALLTNNSNKPNMSSNKFVEDGYVGQGGAIYCTGDLVMNGGTIQQCEAQSGGGIYVENGTFNLNGGVIDSNYARDIVSSSYRKNAYHKNAGGGVYVGDNATMNMSGGTISNNQSSREGGGVSLGWLNHTKGAAISSFITTFNMTGGTFTGNTATSTGGGLNVTAGRQAFISAGSFTDNTANGKEYQPSDSSKSAPVDVYSGGGIYVDAQQKNSSGSYAGKPGYVVVNRVLITDNTAQYWGGGIACCSTSEAYVNASIELDNGTAIYNNTAKQAGNEMHLYGNVQIVGDKVLGGDDYNWSKSGSSQNGYAYDNSLTDSSAAIVEAKKLATVFITGNSGLDGGGIGCNGVLEVGGTETTTSLSITKQWVGTNAEDMPGYIEVQIYRNGKPYGDPVRIYPKADGTWPTYFIDGLDVDDEFTIKEIHVPGFTTNITQEGNKFVITNTRCVVNIPVTKQWADSDSVDHSGDTVTVMLYANGEPTGQEIILDAANGWQGIFEDLPAEDSEGDEIRYEVVEAAFEGYEPGYSIETTEGVSTSTWVQANTLESGKTYRFVSNGVALAATSNGLTGETVSENDTEQQWVVTEASGSYYLQNVKQGKYIYMSGFRLSLSDSKTACTFSDGKLSVRSSGATRYIKLSDGSASAADSGTTLTAYVLNQATTAPTTTVVITNTPVEVPQYVLPETGGIGQIPYTAGGLLLMVAAMSLMYNQKKRRKEETASS